MDCAVPSRRGGGAPRSPGAARSTPRTFRDQQQPYELSATAGTVQSEVASTLRDEEPLKLRAGRQLLLGHLMWSAYLIVCDEAPKARVSVSWWWVSWWWRALRSSDLDWEIPVDSVGVVRGVGEGGQRGGLGGVGEIVVVVGVERPRERRPAAG